MLQAAALEALQQGRHGDPFAVLRRETESDLMALDPFA